GFSIMLLTFMNKVIFWPITHKSTESMRKMSELQPLMTKIREKYKDNPQRQSQEMMALYKEHKVNPVGGCIPMLIQIPVFFALFVVLRIAIELRFAEFLWIKDLSSPERLIEFGFALPIVGWDALNILPILMTLAMYWQQKLMPAGGDPQQQKIMRIMMPGMMFFMLYNFASGLALYWTTQNILVIIQQSIYQYRKKHGQVPAKA
ncbi:MAG: membrane protein insertase YidC, partial [Kiritimatiellae bacterium]|nr:membrane protein insertase YidC [Kiritimatiellia bacterium]